MKKVFYILLGFASIVMSSQSFAGGCPSISSIFQNPSHLDSWQAPWYQGMSEGAQRGEKVVSFTKACWFNYHPEISKTEGNVFCYYKLASGKELSFVQNNWDATVTKPTGSQWTKTQDEACDYVCTSGLGNCGFKGYPPQ